jgi:alanyl-tRNA synthetase
MIQISAGKVMESAKTIGKYLFINEERKDTSVDSMKSLADILRGMSKQPILMMLVALGDTESTVVLSSSGEIDCKVLLEQIKAKHPLKGGGNPKMVQFGGVSKELLPILAEICAQRLVE